MRELDVIQLATDLPDDGLKAGATGTLLNELVSGRVFLAEFDDGVITEVTTGQVVLTIPYFYEGEQVALLESDETSGLSRGQVTIMIKYGAETCVVQARGSDRTYSVPTSQLLLLHWQPAEQSA